MAKIGFIGMGNMGYAMLKGALAAFSPSDIIFSSPDREKCERISSETGVRFAESNAECGNNAKYIVLAVKPQMYPTVLKNIVNVVTEESVIISIAPGITIASINNALGSNIRVVRAMPNTPALIGEGMTGVSYNMTDFSFDERDVIDKFFNSFGKVVYVDEKLMDGIVCASGSSPAYVYMFIEAMADSVVKYGIKRDDAYKLVAQTVLGSAKMGCPIKGDLKYGFPRSNPDGSICLHARTVQFVHPVSKEMIQLTAPVPEGNLWNGFEMD